MKNRFWTCLFLLGILIPVAVSISLPSGAQGGAIACGLASLVALRSLFWQQPETRMGMVLEALSQGLYLTTFLMALFWTPDQNLSEMGLTLVGGLVVFGGFLLMAATSAKPLGEVKTLLPALSCLSAMVAFWAVLVWFVGNDPVMAMLQAMVFGVVISGPILAHDTKLNVTSRLDVLLRTSVQSAILALSVALAFASNPTYALWPALVAAMTAAFVVGGFSLRRGAAQGGE